MKNKLSSFVAMVLLIVFPISVLLLDIIPGLVFVIAMSWGAYYYFSRNVSVKPFSNAEKLFFIAFIPLYLSAWLSAYVNDVGIYHADRFLTLYMIIPVYIFFKNTDVNKKNLWVGLFLGCLTFFVFAVYQSYVLNVDRVTGSTHPIFFGSMSVFMGGIALLSFKQWKGWIWLALPPFAFIMAAVSAILSGSRISFVIIIIYLMLYVIYTYKLVSKKTIIIGALLSIVMLVSVYSTSEYVHNRVDSAITHTLDALQNNDSDVNDKINITSEGLRFQMWKAAWRMFKENPIVGVGWGEYNKEIKVMIKEGFSPNVLSTFNQPHNEYFSALSRGGIIGFLSVLIVFLVPLALFYRQIRVAEKNNFIAFSGFIYVLGFMILSLTADPFQTSRSILAFSFYTAVFMALMNKENVNQKLNIKES